MSDLEISHIWAAKFASDDEQDIIFEELEEYCGEDKPISHFAKSQGEWFYDHDCFYIETKEDFFSHSSIPEDNRNIILSAWNSRLLEGFDYVIVGDEEDFKSPRSCKIFSSEVIYLGKYAHW